ncbi:MAG: endonuclease/exonuclease/phosphatase family protein [Pseudomonadota bacterium]|nr:endonuclease/exonuclease/phosphatase family protein [Pseudomonadota bacterium]
MTDPRNKLVIAAPWPVQYQRALNIRNAVTMLITMKHPNFSLNLLAVDGERSLRQLRTPMLTDIAQIVTHQSIDVIVGDFNAISRSLGFEAFSADYQLVSQAFWGWRGTWPTFLPLYDLDHIWVHQRFQLIKLDFLTHLATDHRGQRIQFSRLVKQ